MLRRKAVKKTSHTHEDIVRSNNFSGIARFVIAKCSHQRRNNNSGRKGETFVDDVKPSLKDYLLSLSSISPETIRGFWRASVLEPRDVLDILLAFESDTGEFQVEVKKIKSLWGVFQWASEKINGFVHLPQSCKIMATMLVRGGMFNDVERLLSKMEIQGLFLDSHDIFSDLIVGYVNQHKLDNAILAYDQMRRLGLTPSPLCYQVLLKYLIQVSESGLAYRVYIDIINMGLGRSIQGKGVHDKMIRLLCRDARVQEARDLIKKISEFGIKPSALVLDAVVTGYCEKQDYDDLLSFFVEMNCAPSAALGNKVIQSLCGHFGVESAHAYMEKLEPIGFCPDEITLGILIGWSCREGDLKNAFVYLSGILSRGLKPHIYTYNALMSGFFKKGMWKHSREILYEMKDSKIKPDLSTFRVLLAGYCRIRQFDEVRQIIDEMIDIGLIQLSSVEDPLSKALMLLGLSPVSVKVRRDNDMGFPKSEFFDYIGNGLYLDTDLDEYDRHMGKILDDAMIPNFSIEVLHDYKNRGTENYVKMIDEMISWGQQPSSSTFSTLVKKFCDSTASIKTITTILDKVSISVYQLDQVTLNKLVCTYSKRGFPKRARTVLSGMLQRHLKVENETYASLLMGLCKKGDLKGFHECWQLIPLHDWSLESKEGIVLLDCLCQQNFLDEALWLFESMLTGAQEVPLHHVHAFLKNLCGGGFASAAHCLSEELSKRDCHLGPMASHQLIIGFCKEKKFAEALMILDTMVVQNMVPSVDVCLQLIPQLCRAGDAEKAISLKDICTVEHPSAFVSAHCALMSGFCKIGRIGEAATLFQEMSMKGLIPDVEVYNTLMLGFCQANNMKKVEELLGFVIKKYFDISISTYRSLLSLICAEGKFHFALSLKERIMEANNCLNPIKYNSLIFYLSSAKDPALMNTIINELEIKGVQLDQVSYNFIIHGFSQCKDVLQSIQYLKVMISKGLTPSSRSLREVISGLCCHGELTEALKLSEEMESRGWLHGSVVQSRIVQALIAHGKLQEAVAFLDRMMLKGLIPNNINYDYIIKQLCQQGRLEKAVDLLNIMLKKENIPDVSSFDHLVQGFCAFHQLEQALDYHAEMLYRNLKPDITTWKILVKSLAEDKQVAEAERLIHLMLQTGETPSREMFCCVINTYRQLNNNSKASELLQTMQRCGYEPDFETHWSLISNLSHSTDKGDSSHNRGFLSTLLSQIGYATRP